MKLQFIFWLQLRVGRQKRNRTPEAAFSPRQPCEQPCDNQYSYFPSLPLSEPTSQKIRMAISQERKELQEIRCCQYDRICKKKNFWILDLWIYGFFIGFLVISREQKELLEIRWFQND